MLLQLTQKCSAECTHCMVSANKNGKTITQKTLDNAIKYINYVNPKVLILTGGEITEIPDFHHIIDQIYCKVNCIIILQSNGWWLNCRNQDEEDIYWYLKEFLKYPRIKMLQISSHEKYYPNQLYNTAVFHKEKIEKEHTNIKVVLDWQDNGLTEKGVKSLTCLGRAANIDEGKNSTGKPNCIGITSRWKQFDKILKTDIPLRQTIKNYKSSIKCEYSKFILMCEISEYLCKPLIDIDGKVHFGESQFCNSFDDVNEYENLTQLESLKRMDRIFEEFKTSGKLCNKCNQVRNCDQSQLKMINLI